MGAQLEHLKDVESILLKFSTPEFVSDYFKLKEIDRQKLLQHNNWDPSVTLGKFTEQEKGFNIALGNTLSGITESEKEFGGNTVQKSFNYFNMAIKPMLEMEVVYGSFQRAYPYENLTLEEFRTYHQFISTKYIDKLEQSMYEYVLKNFPEEAVKPKSPFKFRYNIINGEQVLTKIYLSIHKNKFTDSPVHTFIDFIMRPDIDAKFNWTGTYEELWAFIQFMFTHVLDIPITLNFKIDEWAVSLDDTTNTKKNLSTWLNRVLASRITVNGINYMKDKIEELKKIDTAERVKLRKSLLKSIQD